MHYFEKPDGSQSTEEKQKGSLQSYVLGNVWGVAHQTLKSLRELSAETAKRFGLMGDMVESALSPYFSLSSGCGFAGGGTTLPDGRYLFVSVHDSHYGISDDAVEIVFCKSQYVKEGESHEDNQDSRLRISAKPGKLDYNAVAMALRVIADSIDTHQSNKTSDMAAFFYMMDRYDHDKKEVEQRQHFHCYHRTKGDCCVTGEEENGSGI